MKITLIAPHFEGHSGSIKTLQRFIKDHFPFVETAVLIVDNTKNSCTDPKVFAIENIDLMQVDEGCDLIIYDFFTPVGLIYARRHDIPCICSVPAIIAADAQVQSVHYDQYPELHDPLAVSDGLAFMGDDNIIWSYKGLYDGQISMTNPIFVGSKAQYDERSGESREHEGNLVYMSFGTVVPNSMYDHADAVVRANIISVHMAIIDYFGRHRPELRLVVSSPLPLVHSYANVEVRQYCDQLEMLSRAILFITHGGGNSVNEAIYVGCPMMVLPFFGDQFVSAGLVADRQIGLALDTGALSSPADLGRVSKVLDECFLRLSTFKMRIEYIKEYDEYADNKKRLFNVISKYLKFERLWRPMDLLYGTTVDRVSFVNSYGMADTFKIGQTDEKGYVTVDRLGIIPAIVDQWNDLVRWNTAERIRSMMSSDLAEIAIEYQRVLVSQFGDISNVDGITLIDMCCYGMTFFLSLGRKIHFVVDTMQPDVNPGTHKELQYARALPDKKNIITWIKVDGRYQISEPQVTYMMPSGVQEARDVITSQVKECLNDDVMQVRTKSHDSIIRKLRNGHVIDDLVGVRIICPKSSRIIEVKEALLKRLDFNGCTGSEDSRVWHLHGRHGDVPYEIQLWPSLLYHCFAKEHDTIYKGRDRTLADVDESIRKRLLYRRAQTLLDSSNS